MEYPKTTVLERMVQTLVDNNAHSIVFYMSDKLVTKMTRKMFEGKFSKNTLEVTLTIGKPNYQEREFIKDCKKAGEPFPVKKMQLKFPPKRKK